MRRLRQASLFFAILCLTVLGFAYWLLQRSLPELDGKHEVPGLLSAVDVVRDEVGVSHILAKTFDDVIFVQGYVTAQDRLWQMDVMRRAGYGELAEIFGIPALETDKEQRVLGFKSLALQQASQLTGSDLHLLQRYADGVNAWIQHCRNRLPIEFEILRYQPSPWTPADTLVLNLSLGKLLNSSWKTDLMRQMMRQKLAPSIAEALLIEKSPHDLLLMGDDEKRSSPPGSIARNRQLTLNRRPLSFASNCLKISDIKALLHSFDAFGEEQTVGSNNWVVSGAHSISGKPILANDPHLPLGVPSIWYMTHLYVPEALNVIGVSIPGAPLVIVGHNEHIAWGVTNLAPDVQDLYIETINPKDANSYRVGQRWENMHIRSESIAIRGRSPEVIQVKSTRHGPVLQELAGQALALRWTLFRPKTSVPIQPALNQAHDWNEFVNALETYSGPPQNWVYADRSGNIGFLNAGSVPIRSQGDGSVPVPGESDAYEWIGEIPFSKLPRLFNPPSGIIITANNRIVGDSYPYALTRNWISPHRARRIHSLLTARPYWNAEEMLTIQGDVHADLHTALRGTILDELQRTMSNADPEAKQEWHEIQQLLEKYDLQTAVESTAATVCEKFKDIFLEEILKDKLGDDWKLYQWGNRSTVVENLLSRKDEEFLPRSFASYDHFIIYCLQRTRQELRERFHSTHSASWTWGDYVPLEFKHPLASFWPLTWILNTGPYPQPGAPSTVKQTSANHGVSMRLVVDFSNPDQSFNNITLGQSGHPLSPHYRDQIQSWREAKSFPMRFTLAKVRQDAVSTSHLFPQQDH